MVTGVREKKSRRNLSAYEQETIINFNKGEDIAHIFTYEKTWQKHLEQRLGLKPVMDNGYGGRGYELPKSRIPMPRAKRRFSAGTKKKMVARGKKLAASRQQTLF